MSNLIEGVSVAGTEDDDEGNTITKNKVTGILADRIRARLKDSGQVYIIEDTSEYGDYTKEIWTEFQVRTKSKSQTFHPDRHGESWLEQAGRAEFFLDGMYLRFETWLQAAERPQELFDEWFELTEQVPGATRWELKPDNIIWRTIKARPGYWDLGGVNIDHIGDTWKMDIVQKADDRGFRAIMDRHGLSESENQFIHLVIYLTDRFMPGYVYV